MAAPLSRYVRDKTHIVLVDGGVGPAFLVRAIRTAPTSITCVRSGPAAFCDFTLTFDTAALADAFWALLDAALV